MHPSVSIVRDSQIQVSNVFTQTLNVIVLFVMPRSSLRILGMEKARSSKSNDKGIMKSKDVSSENTTRIRKEKK